jgi:hypothetical protein
MDKFEMIIKEDSPFPTVKINGNVIPIFNLNIHWDVDNVASVELRSWINESSEINIETDKLIINAFPVDDEVGRKIFKSLLKRYYPETIISNWIDNEDRISDQEAWTAIELFYKFLLGE